MIPIDRAEAIARKVAESLQPFCHRIEVAGSIRRQRPECGDVDLVLAVHDRPGLLLRLRKRCRIQAEGEQNIVATMPDGTSLDLWIAHAHAAVQPDFFGKTRNPTMPDNFGSLLLCRTGSKYHNIALAERAKRLGLSWNPHWGVYRAGVCIASASEEEIFAALQLPFTAPADREADTRPAFQRITFAPVNQEAIA